jgi:iron complex outermembrane receptor protein
MELCRGRLPGLALAVADLTVCNWVRIVIGVVVTARSILWTTILVLALSRSVRAVSGGSEGSDPNGAAVDLFDMSIEELMDIRVDTVYGASKRSQSVAAAPASVTIVTAEEIRRYGYRTLADVLRSAPGFYINYDRSYHFIGTRGFRRPGDYDTRILLLIDGHRLNDNVGDSPLFGTQFPLDVELIERVEIIRGPGSSLYGSNAVLAVVNVITKQGAGVGGLELSGKTGSFDSQTGRITYGNRLRKNLDLLLSATTYNSDGPELYFREFDSVETNNGWVHNDDDQFDNFVARASWAISRSCLRTPGAKRAFRRPPGTPCSGIVAHGSGTTRRWWG